MSTTIHPRRDWTSRAPKGTTALVASAVRYIAIHWPGSNGSLSPTNTAGYLRGWQDYHMDVRGWRDIAYNEAVDQQGEAWTCRGENADGSVSGMGGKVYSILAVLGTNDSPTEDMLVTIAARAAAALKRYPNAKIVGHRDLKSTECPGADVYAWLKQGMPTGTGTTTPTLPKPPTSGGVIPAFPLPGDRYYFGPRTGPVRSVSGYYHTRSNGKRGHDGLATWQSRAKALGLYTGGVDGLYGPLTESAAKAVQRRAKLAGDGLIGPATWPATWTI